MGTGNKYRNGIPIDGASWQDRYGIAAAAAAKLNCVVTIGADNEEKVLAWYTDSGAITLTDYAGFPKGTIIFDEQSYKDHMKVADEGTSTWKTSAARS